MGSESDDRKQVLREREDSREWDDLINQVVLAVVVVVVAAGALFGVASLLDDQFGWNLTGWMKDLVGGIVSSIKSA